MKKVFWRICNLLHKYIAKPRMILGYSNSDGNFLANTRVSNTVEIVAAKNLSLGDNVFIGHYNYIEASHGISIGEGCQLTSFISMTTHSSHNSIRLYGSHYIQHNGQHKGYVIGGIIIGKYTFIGPHTVIMPGSKIGKGSIVSAYSFVKGEFPDFAIIAGNPAVQIGDTREVDNLQLTNYPELCNYYQEWVGNK